MTFLVNEGMYSSLRIRCY